jgi:hypothetical protein
LNLQSEKLVSNFAFSNGSVNLCRYVEAERLVREMTRAGVSAGPRLYNTLIAAHGRSGDLKAGLYSC